jgi:DNA/RNA endonuclease YhcR with UshA esterase domain
MRRLLTLVFLFLPLDLTAATPTYIPIAAARQQAHKTTVTVLGLVTVPSGDFSSSSGDEGFAIQDQTGGIWVSVPKNPNLKVGQLVQVTGVLGVSAAKLQIVPAAPSGVRVLPGTELRVATGRVGKATLGFIITIEGTVTAQGAVPDKTYGYKVYLNDGSGPAQVYLNLTTDIDPHSPDFKPGTKLRVTGFGNQYDKAYEVDPRSKKDIVVLK